MTEDRREECKKYKDKAVEYERKLERNRFLTKCNRDLEDLRLRTERMRMRKSLESQLVFESRQSGEPAQKSTNLTRETIDVSEYSNEGVKVMTKPTPKLIRSNSYTLDTPSPILLAHLEREAQKCISNNSEYVDSDSSHELNVTETDITIKSVTISSSRNDDVLESDLCDILTKLPEDTARTIMDIFERPQVNHEEERKEWAARKIGAWVRGYLVRRLMQTDKVQSLIDTIKDALVCAIQLHTVDVIEEADVELHRRLIQQVSAACFAFHDIFFALSTKEQMEIIAADRTRRLEKIMKNRGTLTDIIQVGDSQTAR